MKMKFYEVYAGDEPRLFRTIAEARRFAKQLAKECWASSDDIEVERCETVDLPGPDLIWLLLQEKGGYIQSREVVERYSCSGK